MSEDEWQFRPIRNSGNNEENKMVTETQFDFAKFQTILKKLEEDEANFLSKLVSDYHSTLGYNSGMREGLKIVYAKEESTEATQDIQTT